MEGPLSSTFVTGRQFYYTPGGFHQPPSPVCFREDSAVTGHDGRARLQLPEPAEISALAPRADSDRPYFPYSEALVYHPGYCAERKQITKVDRTNTNTSSVRMNLIVSRDSAEQRLRYLSHVIGRWRTSCGTGDSRRSPEIQAMLAEMDSVANTTYEKFLVESARFELDPSRPRPYMAQQIVRVPSDAEVTFDERIVGIGPKAPHFGAGPRPEVQYVFRCRSGDACDFNARDESGRTELMKAASKPDVPFMRDLLASGADPTVEISPGGDMVMDQVVRSAIQLCNAPEGGRLNDYIGAIRLLSKNPTVSISQDVESRLKVEESEASRSSSNAADNLRRLRAELRGVPVRSKLAITCAGF